ncbi:hypothetical protein HCU64_19365 [Methylobacterium sp. C25]|uniref:hypothetical protein n=1 Tax=Methylobacterium sp. C25 TaxID=2721622 RepID=UPI001F483596|nr:hypothetical protein [Methylobacterium sp. C25]MCE4225916.1 hypothetical protein [Methylobacterium sp. C25]
METKLINIGDGRFIEAKENPPSPSESCKKKPRAAKRYTKKKRVLRKGFVDRSQKSHPGANTKFKEIPGYTTWVSERTKELEAVNPVRNHKSRFGIPNGMNREEAEAAWAATSELVERDIQWLKKAGVLTDAEVMAEEAMRATLQVMRGPVHQRLRLAAARQVLEWTKPKSAGSSNVSVEAAEDWLEGLAKKLST